MALKIVASNDNPRTPSADPMPAAAATAQVDNYADHPVTLGEARSESAGPEAWAPRDVLVHLLRKIDAGELSMDRLIIVGRGTNEPNELDTYISGMDADTAIGMMARAKFNLLAETSLSIYGD
jgi:hypothetical protein